MEEFLSILQSPLNLGLLLIAIVSIVWLIIQNLNIEYTGSSFKINSKKANEKVDKLQDHSEKK